jgi:hypothetical protein
VPVECINIKSTNAGPSFLNMLSSFERCFPPHFCDNCVVCIRLVQKRKGLRNQEEKGRWE